MIIYNIPLTFLIVCVLSYNIAEMLKILIRLIQGQEVSMKQFFSSGGMPSSHSSTIVSLTIAILLYEGFNTNFVIAAIVSSIVLSDAVGVRQDVGKTAEIINKSIIKNKEKKLNELAGHTPSQVLVGSLVGTIVAIIFYII